MESRRKRALLARVEGQLAAMERDIRNSLLLRWKRVHSAVMSLGKLPRDETEARYLAQLQRHIAVLHAALRAQSQASLITHRFTLARADCVIWQIHLRHQSRPVISRAA